MNTGYTKSLGASEAVINFKSKENCASGYKIENIVQKCFCLVFATYKSLRASLEPQKNISCKGFRSMRLIWRCNEFLSILHKACAVHLEMFQVKKVFSAKPHLTDMKVIEVRAYL